MRLLDIIIKEISVVKSQKIAMLLIVLYPLLAVGLLGFGLTGSMDSFSNSRIGIVNTLPYALDIQKEVFGEKNIILMDYNTTDELIYAVKTKDVIVGLDITAKNKSSQITVDLYYDNSNIVAGATFKEFAKITLGSFALTQTRNQLSKIWDVLSLLGKNLDSEVSQLNNFRLQLDSAKESLDTLEQKLNMVDFKEIEDTLDSQKNSISSFEKESRF